MSSTLSLDKERRSSRRVKKNCIMRSFIIGSLHHKYYRLITSKHIGMICSTKVGDDKCKQSSLLVGKSEETTWDTSCRWNDDLKVDLKGIWF
jgi:hypothetical protein